jgi:hypothetical protein
MTQDVDPDGYGSYVFRSEVIGPDGIIVLTQATVPVRALWDSSGERVDTVTAVPSVVQQAATDAMNRITQLRNEVPF